MKSHNTFSRILDGLILLMFVLFFASAGFQDKITSGWYQQWFPNLNGSTIQDMTFLDSLTGYAVTTTNSSVQAYIVKTTNGGDNWNIVYTYVPPSVNSGFTRIQFANSNIGYASTNYFDLLKTINGGLNWFNYPNLPSGAEDFAVINKDTLFYVQSSPILGGLFRSINGGISWTNIWTNGSSGNPEKIYMFDKNLGFIINSSYYMKRTTNGGFNWTEVNESFGAIKFFDSNTGWKIWDSLKKSTNGGINWVTQITPNISYYFSDPSEFSVLNKDTVWMVGAEKFHKPPVYKTINGGTNWGYQYPDTTLQIYKFGFIQFVNSKVGWINPASPTSLMHTTVGGNDTTYITGIENNTGIELSDYQLFQNYPNPFNTTSKIKYKTLKSSTVRIEVMNILGKNIQTIVNKKQSPGNYEVNFNGENLGSGIYFYSMIIDGKVINTKRMILLK